MKALPILLVLLVACASNVKPELPSPPTDVHVIISRAVADYLSMLHFRLWGHGKLPDHEWVTCLKGTVGRDTVWVTDISATQIIEQSDSTVRYLRCAGPEIVGAAHNHPPTGKHGEACWHSGLDAEAQDRAGYVVSIVTCGTYTTRFMARVHPHYHTLASR